MDTKQVWSLDELVREAEKGWLKLRAIATGVFAELEKKHITQGWNIGGDFTWRYSKQVVQ